MDTYLIREINTGQFDRFQFRQAFGLSFYLSESLQSDRTNKLPTISSVIRGNMPCIKGAERDADSAGLVNNWGHI